MITRKMIENGFKNGKITIEDSYGGCLGICCKIGDNAFYFVGSDDNLTKEEVKQKLYEIATDHKKDDENLLYYPEDKDSIEENMETESLFCMVNFEDYDVVITAKDFRGMDWKQ